MGKLDAPKGRLIMKGDDLDDRQIDGLLLHRAVLDGQTRRIAISNGQSIYLSSKDPGVRYTVERTERNRRGSRTVEYRCSCPDSAKQGRRDCQHRFAEKLLCGDVFIAGEPDAVQLQSREQIKAGRRPARQRFGYDGRTIRSVQRAARVRMSREIPRLILSLRTAWDAQHSDALLLRNARLTADSVRAAALILKISEGRSADAMVARYQQLIDDGMFPLNRAPHQNTLSLWMNDPVLTPLLHKWLAMTTWPFRVREIAAIADATKVSQLRTAHARCVDYGPKDKRPTARWMSAHVLTGVETMVVMSVIFSKSHESKHLIELLDDALPIFNIRFLLADKAYLAEKTVLGPLWERSVKAVIPVKFRWDAETKKDYYEACKELADWYDNRPRLFDEVYRLRPKIEGLFSLTKRLADGYCWSRGRPRDDADFSTAWQNETLCKFIYMNLRTTVLLEEETGTEIDYQIRSRFFPPPDEPLIRHDA